MEYKSPGHFRTASEFRVHFHAIDARFDCVESLPGPASAFAQPIAIGNRAIGNRWAIQPMEGWDGTRDGRPSEYTFRRWRNFGRSGAKLIWGGEAFAVQEDGRANPNQLFLNPEVDVAADLSRLREAILAGHAEAKLSADDIYIGLQLTHSGRFSRPDGEAAPRTAYVHPILDTRHRVPEDALLTDAELEVIAEHFIRSAKLAHETGYDFVDVKCCHGYLLHELLSARLRSGRYGGSFENRTRLIRRIIEGIRSACPGLEVGVRVSIADMFPFSPAPDSRIGAPLGMAEATPYACGFGVDARAPVRPDLTEPLQFLGLLSELGVRLINVTLGVPYYSAHMQRPAAYPPSDGYLPPEDPLVGVQRHLATVRACKAAYPDMLFVGSGYSHLQEWLPHVAEYEVAEGHTDFVGIGRMVLSYPQLPLDALRGRPLQRKFICRTFSDCTTAPRNGLRSGCYPLDPFYKATDAAEELKAIKKGLTRA